jgi:diguanylate cyclase (GGDEF)-like protein
LGCIILYWGAHIFSALRLSLQQNAVRLFLAAAILFTLHEALFFLPNRGEAIHVLHEILQTGFIGCLCLAMRSIVRSQKTEINDLHRLADIDQLTGLENLTAFRRLAFQTIRDQKSAQLKTPNENLQLAVLMIDIDHFKCYNDDYGHEEGNVALQAVARAIRLTARTTDLVARYGGEEFVVLMPLSPADAVATTERIRFAVESECTPEFNSLIRRQITVSIGLAVPGQTSNSAEELLDELVKVADYELYRAKREGRNRVSASIDV